MCSSVDTITNEAKDCAVCNEQTTNPLYKAECEERVPIGPNVPTLTSKYYAEYICSEPCMAEYEHVNVFSPTSLTNAVILG